MSAHDVRERRRQAASKYKPNQVRLLLVAEAPPKAPDRYFFFEDVRKYDWLFRAVAKAILGGVPTREEKRDALVQLKEKGVFLIDLSEEPVGTVQLESCVSGLVERCRALSPKRIILIKATVFDIAYLDLARAGLPVVDERIPFPASGQQRRFEVAFIRALDSTA